MNWKKKFLKKKKISAVLWLLPQMAEYWKTGRIKINEDNVMIVDLFKFLKRSLSKKYKIKGKKNEITRTEIR